MTWKSILFDSGEAFDSTDQLDLGKSIILSKNEERCPALNVMYYSNINLEVIWAEYTGDAITKLYKGFTKEE